MTNITKKLKLTTVKYVTTVVEDGAAKVVDMPVRAFSGTVSRTRVTNVLKKELGDVSFTIISMETAERTYTMDLDTFLQYAKVVEDDSELEGAGGDETSTEETPTEEDASQTE